MSLQICSREAGEAALARVAQAAEEGSSDYGRVPLPVSLAVGTPPPPPGLLTR